MLHVVAKAYALVACVASCLHFIFTVSSVFCPSDKFGVRAKQLEHEGTTHPLPLTKRKELKVSYIQDCYIARLSLNKMSTVIGLFLVTCP